MTPRERLLDPTGGGAVVSALVLAPRPRSLRGLRLALLDNAKPNAATLLAELGEQLRGSHGLADVSHYTKGYFGTPVEETQIQRILRNCDFAVAGIGD
jgi:hypothetical protein